MYIGLGNLELLFKDCPHLLMGTDHVHCLGGWLPLSQAPQPYSDHLLYVCTLEELKKSTDVPSNIHILCITPEKLAVSQDNHSAIRDKNTLFIGSENVESVYQTLQEYFNKQCGLSLFTRSLFDYMTFDSGLQAVIDEAYHLFANPIYVFDANFNLLAATWEYLEKNDSEAELLKTHRLNDSQAFKMMNRDGNLHRRIMQSDVPVQAHNEYLGCDQMYCAIDTVKNLGHIVVSAIYRPFEKIDVDAMISLKRCVRFLMQQDTFIRQSHGFSYEFLLKDLLEGKLSTHSDYLSTSQYVQSEFYKYMFTVVIETARSNQIINVQHIRSRLEAIFPNSKTIIYQGQIIAVIMLPDTLIIPSEYEKIISDFAKEYGLFAGVSMAFQDIFRFAEYYKQALRAIEYGISADNQPGAFLYRTSYMKHLKNVFLQKEDPNVFCHPFIRILKDYDKEHHSDLAYTLYMYLTHERNAVLTGEAMDMHRTSIAYRLKKITSLIGDDHDDFKDAAERMYIILSYELCTE